MECLVFVRCWTKNEGLSYADAVAYDDALHDQATMLIGRHVKMYCVPCNLKDTRNDLCMARQFTRRETVKRISDQRGTAHQKIE